METARARARSQTRHDRRAIRRDLAPQPSRRNCPLSVSDGSCERDTGACDLIPSEPPAKLADRERVQLAS